MIFCQCNYCGMYTYPKLCRCIRYTVRMRKSENNYAFIDSQNLNLGIQKLGLNLDYKKFRIYLAEKYAVKKAYLFIGFVALNQSLYDRLQEAGFILKFKPTVPDADGKIKGNIDADLVLHAALALTDYDRAVIVSSDGDFHPLVQYLYENKKLEVVLSPDIILFCTSQNIWQPFLILSHPRNTKNTRQKIVYFSCCGDERTRTSMPCGTSS